MINVTIEITGKDKAISQLESIKRVLHDFKPELQKTGDYLMDFFINSVFDSQGSIFQEPWAPLSKAYAEIKARKWGSTQILVASGAMRANYKLYTASDYLIIRNEQRTRNGQFLARFHQDGTPFMPQRVMMKFDTIRLNRIVDIIVKGINQRVKSVL